MIETEKNKLRDEQKRYISIGITEDGIPRGLVGIPWEKTAHAFNMKIPDVYISPEDLENREIMEMIGRRTVVGFYSWVPLKDYDFLTRFPDIRDISIRYGENIKDLEFLRNATECGMLFLENAHLDNIDVILEMKKAHPSIFGCFKCVGLYNCRVDDLSRFNEEKPHFSEFLIWNDGEKYEYERWSAVSANTFRYYDVDEKE